MKKEYEIEHEDEERCELFDDTTNERMVCNIRRFEMIKYSFGEDEEYVAIKEHEYDDLKSTNEDACRMYQEIFHRMDEGYGSVKNHKKTVKHGQTRARESEEYKAEARKVKPQSNHGQQKSTRPKIFHLSPSSFRKVQKWSLNPNGPHPDS
ncbi:hypothetical protein Tco_0321076 [Tanacetum coccineum]